MQVLFERFISHERNEPPDIDVDFEHERREEIIQDSYAKYGRERTALTAALVTYRPKSAMRDVGKVLELSLDQVDRLGRAWSGGSRALPNTAFPSCTRPVSHCWCTSPPGSNATSRQRSRQLVRTTGIVTCRQSPAAANGIVFVTLEDEIGMINVIVWKRGGERFRKELLTARLLAVFGTIGGRGRPCM